MCSSYQAFGFLYGISAILWLLYFTKDPSTDLSGGFIGDEGAMPYISKYNASLVMERRFDEIHRTYSEAMSSHRWKPLRVISGISIEKLDAVNWPPFIRTTALIDSPPKATRRIFEWASFDETQRHIDPYYESSKLYLELEPSVHLIRKTTKRPLGLLAGREFQMALIQKSTKAPVAVRPPLGSSPDTETVVIPKGTLQTCLVSAYMPPSITGFMPHEAQVYTRAYQDFMAWYEEVNGEDGRKMTRLSIVMRVDLGQDIPRWAFLLTVASTGITSMQKLQKYAKWRQL